MSHENQPTNQATTEEIIAVIRQHQEEYATEAEQQYREALTADRVSDSAIHSEAGAFAVAKLTALSRVLEEVASLNQEIERPQSVILDEAMTDSLDAEQFVKRSRQLPPWSEGEVE